MKNGNNTGSTDVDVLFRQAASHFQTGELATAGHVVHRILEIDPAHAEANSLAGLIAIQNGQNEVAVNALARAIEASPLVPFYYYNYGIALYARGRTDDALAAYEKALRLNPGFVEAHLNRGITLNNCGRPEEALASYASALRIKPGLVAAWFNRGNTLVALQRMEEAQADYEQAIRLRPDFVEAHYNLANLLKQTQHWGQALASYEKAIQLDPEHAEAHNALGELLALGSRFDAGLAAYDRAIANRPDFAQAHFNRGQCLKQSGRLPEAAAAYRTALQHDPGHVEAAYFLNIVDAQAPPARSPREYILKEFDGFAESFDKHLVDALGYRVPWLLFDAVNGLTGDSVKKFDILDLGCGTGLVGVACSTLARRLDGVDLSPRMLARARERCIYTDLIEMDVCQALEQASRHYDLILSADVFIYIGDLVEVFSLATQRLQGGGLFAFSIEVIEGGQDYQLARSGRYRQSLAYIRKLANANGLEEVSCAPIIVRTEQDRPVDGYIMVLRLPLSDATRHPKTVT